MFWFRLDGLYLNQSCVNFPVTNTFEPGEPFLRGLDRSFRRPRRSNDDRALAAVKELFASGNFIDEAHAVAWHLSSSCPARDNIIAQRSTRNYWINFGARSANASLPRRLGQQRKDVVYDERSIAKRPFFARRVDSAQGEGSKRLRHECQISAKAAMDRTDLDQMSKLSPFELKDTLIRLASRHSERLMLNAGRGNPNFLAAVPRHGFFQPGLFAMSEAERSSSGMPEGVGGLPEPDGIATRFEKFVKARRSVPGVAFLAACVSLARERLEFSDDDLLYEPVEGVLGCNYPSPVRMLRHTEKIVRHYLREEMTGGVGSREKSTCSRSRAPPPG